MAETILQEADRLINGDRLDTYEGTDNTIVALWSAYLGLDLTVLDYANLMILLKLARTKGQYHRDSYVDIAGYAGVGPRLWEEQEIVDLDVPAEDSFFIDHMTRPAVPRVWGSLDEVPAGVSVRDKDGDLLSAECISSDLMERENGKPWADRFAPFTEVKETA